MLCGYVLNIFLGEILRPEKKQDNEYLSYTSIGFDSLYSQK
jgi:hypothetical protein